MLPETRVDSCCGESSVPASRACVSNGVSTSAAQRPRVARRVMELLGVLPALQRTTNAMPASHWDDPFECSHLPQLLDKSLRQPFDVAATRPWRCPTARLIKTSFCFVVFLLNSPIPPQKTSERKPLCFHPRSLAGSSANLAWNEVQVLQLGLAQVFRTTGARLKQEVKSVDTKCLRVSPFLRLQHQPFLGSKHGQNIDFQRSSSLKERLRSSRFCPYQHHKRLVFLINCPTVATIITTRDASAGKPLDTSLRQQISLSVYTNIIVFFFSMTGWNVPTLFWLLPQPCLWRDIIDF